MHVALILVVHCIITLHFFAGWPFDEVNSENDKQIDYSAAMDLYGSRASNLTDCTADECLAYSKADKELWGKGLFIAFDPRGYFSDEQKTAVFMYQVLTIVMLVVIMVVYFGRTNFNELYKLFIGVPKDTTDVARRPNDPDKDYFIEGKDGEEIPSTAYDVDLNLYIPELKVAGLQFTQLATRLPEWHKIVFSIQAPKDVEAAKEMISEELYVHPQNIEIDGTGNVVVLAAGTAEAQIVRDKSKSLQGLTSEVTLMENDTKPKTMDDPKEDREKAWFTEAHLSWTANKHLKCLNLQGDSVPATYRQNSLYYDPILSAFEKHLLFSRCMVFKAPDRKDVEKMMEIRASEYKHSLLGDTVPDIPSVPTTIGEEAIAEKAETEVSDVNLEFVEEGSSVEMAAPAPMPSGEAFDGGIPDFDNGIPEPPAPAEDEE